MTQEERRPGSSRDRKFSHYTPNTGELFSAFVYYALRGEGGEVSGNIPSDQQFLTEGLIIAIKSVPELYPLINNWQLAVEARVRLEKLKKDGTIVEKDGRYEFGEKQRVTNTFGSGPTIMFTPEGIRLLKGAAATAQSVWSPKTPEDSSAIMSG